MKRLELLPLERSVHEQSLVLTDDQVRSLERLSYEPRERHIETRHAGDLVADDTFFVDIRKGVRRIFKEAV